MREFELANGLRVPAVGLGTWQLGKDSDETTRLVCQAIAYGYRKIDTAAGYRNEEAIGKAIRQCGVERKDLFITTKIDDVEHAYSDAKEAVYRSLEKLGTDYLDLCLIHAPNSRRMWEHAKACGYDQSEYRKKLNSEAWEALCVLQAEGVIRGVGVSNFSVCHIEELVQETGKVPLFNQIKLCIGCYPLQKELIAYCRKHGIQLEAYRPLGRGGIAKIPFVQWLADKYCMSPYQVGLHFLWQEQICYVPKASNRERMQENLREQENHFQEEEMEHLRRIFIEEKWAEVRNPDVF